MIIAALALWAGLAASAAPEPAPAGADCAAYAGDDRKLCAALAVLLPDVEAIWNKPYEIPRRLPGLEKNWEGLKDLSPAAQEKLPPALREQWTAVADSVAKFPTAEQYRTLTGLAKADAPELRAALKAAGAAWAPDAGEKAGAFLALDEKGAPSAPLPPDALKALSAALSAAPKGPSEAKAEGGKAAPDAKSGEPVADAAGLAKIFDAAQDAAPLDERASPGPRRAAAAPAEPAPPQPPQPKKSAAAPAAAEAPRADAPGVAVLKGEKSMLLAMVAAGVPGAAENLVEVDRELLRADSDRAAESWLKTHGSSAGPAGAEAALDASASGELESAALKKLVEARGEVLAAGNDEGREAAREKIKAAAAALQEAQRAIMKSDPAYFKAREAWAAYVEYNRKRLPEFADGARFTADELGLPPGAAAGEIVKTSRRDRDGKPLGGVSYRNKDGLEHFETYDRKVSRDELKAGGGKSVYMENDDRDPGGKMVTVFYDDELKKTGATVLTPLGQGLFEMADEAKPWPKTRGRFAGGQFVAERSDNENGSHRVLDAKTGIWVSWPGQEEQGLPDSMTVDDAKGVNGIKDPRERKAALDALASAFIRGRFPHKEKELPEQFQYEADSVSAMLDDYLRSAKGGAQITFSRDSQLLIDEFDAKGALLRQVAGTFEPTLSGRGDWGAHKVPLGLTVSIRNAAASPDARFVRVGQYLGNWGREEVRSRQDSNAENFSSWFVGVTVTENASVIRYARDAAAGGEFHQFGEPTALPPEQLYSGVGVVGAFRDAAAIVGKGTVNMIGAGVSVGLAASPFYAAVVCVTGGDGEAARRDLMERAKANYFQNAVSQELGRIYTNGAYQDGLASLGIDSSKNVQNVGQEMKGLGYEGAGAVLQGGVNFANSQFNPEQYLMIKGLSFLGSGALGSTGKLVETLIGGKMTVEAGAGLGTAGNRMLDAYVMYDEHDPASRAEYYDAMRSVTEQGLGAPMLFGALFEHGKPAEPRETGLVERAEARAGSPVERALDSKLLNFGSESAPGAKSLKPWEIGRWVARESHIDLGAKRAPAAESPAAGTPDAPPPLAAAAPRRRLTLTENIDPTGRRENVLAGKLDGADVVVKIDAAPTEFAAQNAAHEALARGQASGEAPENVHVPKALARAPGKAFLEKALAAGDRINTFVGEEMQDRAREEGRAAVVSERVPADAVSLKDLVNKTPKGAESGIELGPEDFAALEKAVAYLNGKNVRHMDLSNPSNVLVRRANGRAEFYLIDWEGVPKPSAMPDAAALAEIRGKLGLPPEAGRAAVEPPPAAKDAAPAEDAVGGAATGVHAIDADAVRIHGLKERLAAAPAAAGAPIALSGEEAAALTRTVDSLKEALRRNIGTQKDILEGLPLGARQEQAGARGQLSSIARQLEGTTIRFEEKAGEVQAGAYAHYERESKAVVIAQRYTDLAYQHPDLMAVILEHELQHAGDLSGTDVQSARLWRGASEYRRGGANPEYVVTEALAHGSELLALDAVLKDHGIRADQDPGALRPRLVAEFGEAGARFMLETAGLKDYAGKDPTIFRYLLEKMPTYAEQLAGVQEGQTPARQLLLRARAMKETQKLLDVKVASLDPALAKPAYDSLKTSSPAEAERLMDDVVQRGRYESLQQEALRYRAGLRETALAEANELLAERGEPPAADRAAARAALQRRYDVEKAAADKARAADPAAYVKAAKAYLPLSDVLNAMDFLGEGPAPAPPAVPASAAAAPPLARAAPGGAMEELGGFWRKVRDFVLPPPDAARDIYDARIVQDRAAGAAERIAAVLKDMRASDAQVGQLDLSPTRIQTESDCQIRSLYNHPEMEPLRRALTYDEVLDLSHRVANTRIEADGTARGTLAQILRELGYDLTRDQPLTTAADLARDLDGESGEFVNIFWKVRRGPEASHAIVLTGAYRNGADWSFVAVDSNMKGPVAYTFAELQALGAATYRPRPRPIDGREPSAGELSGLAAAARRRYSASGVSARSLKRSDLRPVRTVGLETERRTDPLGSGWTAVGASRQGAMTVALVDPGTGRSVSTWEIARAGKRAVIREGKKLVGTVDPGETAPMNSWSLRVRADGIAELRLADPFAEVQASYELKVPKAP